MYNDYIFVRIVNILEDWYRKIQFNGIFKLDFSILHVGCHNNSSVENGWYVRL